MAAYGQDPVEMIPDIAKIVFIVVFLVVAVRAFMVRGLPRVGGKIGRQQKIADDEPIPPGISSVYARSMRLFVSSADAVTFSSQKDYLRQGTREIPAVMRIYRVAGCKTEIEIPAGQPDYERIDISQALSLLRELPDMRLVRRLHISDQPSFMDSWERKMRGQDVFLLGHATNFGLVVLYRPDSRFLGDVGMTLLHEWMHIAAYKYQLDLWRFGRANNAEPLGLVPFDVRSGSAWKLPHEAWAEVGEKLLGYDGTLARQAAQALPLHATILWRRMEKILRRAPQRMRSTRFAELEARRSAVHAEITPLVKARKRH